MNRLINRSKLFVKRNASTILTYAGAGGVVVTSVMTAAATPKALMLLEEAKLEKQEPLTKTEIVQVAGPAYIPSILVGVYTIVCIFGANTLNKHRQAALVSAYALLDSSYKEYKTKVAELYGEDANNAIRDSIAEDTYDETAISVSEGKELFYDVYSDRYFESTVEDVIAAEYKMATTMLVNSGASVNIYYDALGLDHYDVYDRFGWAWSTNEEMYWVAWTEFKREPMIMENETECTMITMPFEPLIDYEYY